MGWVLNDPEKAPAFIMADQGYDVWLGNNRGNFFGQQHIKFKLHSKEFWDFD
jgi:lysosomal acid lipase/cholesteryl ester hydrolase